MENVFCFKKYFKCLWIHENHICELRMKTWIWKRSSQNHNYLSSNENKAWKKFRPVRDLNPWPLQYRCSALPIELTSQLEAGHYVGSETDPWSDKAGALNGRLMYSDGGTTHGRGVTLCVSRHNLRKNRKKKNSSTNVKEMEKERPSFDLVFIVFLQ